jgi:hypothetical protein
MIEYYLSLNRGGRKVFRDGLSPRALWPYVLERTSRLGRWELATKIEEADLIYYTFCNRAESI